VKAKTAKEFAAELEAAGCRITWDKERPETEFEAKRNVCLQHEGKHIRQARTVRVWFNPADPTTVGSDTFFWCGWRGSNYPLRSMKAVREYLGIEVTA
jgi:hypothetical protein